MASSVAFATEKGALLNSDSHQHLASLCKQQGQLSGTLKLQVCLMLQSNNIVGSYVLFTDLDVEFTCWPGRVREELPLGKVVGPDCFSIALETFADSCTSCSVYEQPNSNKEGGIVVIPRGDGTFCGRAFCLSITPLLGLLCLPHRSTGLALLSG